MTITANGFANYVHCDKDFIPIAYGWWFAARKMHNEETNLFEYALDENVGHQDISGGAFLWAALHCGMDFQRYIH